MSPEEAIKWEHSLRIDADSVVQCLRCPCGGAFHRPSSSNMRPEEEEGTWICVSCRRPPSVSRLVAAAYLLGVSGGKAGHAERVAKGETQKWETQF